MALTLIWTRLTVIFFKTLTEKSGIIQTPNYPDPYDANTDCYWEFIRPDEGQCVVFTVEDFNIDTEEQVKSAHCTCIKERDFTIEK